MKIGDEVRGLSTLAPTNYKRDHHHQRSDAQSAHGREDLQGVGPHDSDDTLGMMTRARIGAHQKIIRFMYFNTTPPGSARGVIFGQFPSHRSAPTLRKGICILKAFLFPRTPYLRWHLCARLFISSGTASKPKSNWTPNVSPINTNLSHAETLLHLGGFEFANISYVHFSANRANL